MVKPEPFDIPCRDGLSIRGEVHPAESPIGSVVISHGFKGFAHWAFFPYLARTLAQDGLTAITFDFSGSGIGTDRESFTQAEAFASNTFSRELEDLELIEDYARRMYPRYAGLNLPTWIIGPALGDGPLVDRPADILKVWPEREPLQRLPPAEFNPILDRLAAAHCGPARR